MNVVEYYKGLEKAVKVKYKRKNESRRIRFF